MADDGTPPSGGRSASEFRDIADALRNRVDLFGKTLAAVATLGTTAVGLSRIGDLSPWDGNVEWVLIACGGLVVAAFAAILVAVRLMRVARPVFMRAELDKSELDTQEQKAVRPVFDEAAKRFGFLSLVALEARERALRNAAAEAMDEDERARRTALADGVKDEIEQALARGQVVTIRRRAANAVTGWSLVLYLAVMVGLLAFAVGADRVSDRKDRIADAKACGDARKATATKGEMGRASPPCDKEAEKGAAPSKPPSAEVARAQIAEKLTAVSKACSELVQKKGDAKSGPLKNEECNAIREAVVAMDPPTKAP